MTATDYALVVAIWAGYAALASACIWGVLRVTEGAAKWQRRALVSLILAVFFAPSAVGGGHGGGVGPAWMALFQMFPMKLGVMPILVSFVVFFIIGSIASRLRRKQEIPK